jgi:hypothetical protein
VAEFLNYEEGFEYNRNGYSIYYYDEYNSLVSSCGSWKNNKRIGEWKWYHSNGNIHLLVHYRGEGNGYYYMEQHSFDGILEQKDYYLVD